MYTPLVICYRAHQLTLSGHLTDGKIIGTKFCIAAAALLWLPEKASTGSSLLHLQGYGSCPEPAQALRPWQILTGSLPWHMQAPHSTALTMQLLM
jgi:hypothetical protein